MNPTPDAAKIRSLHGLRGVMAWWVVLGHVSLAFGWRLPLIDRNTLAVDVFILLSGFVIAMLIDRKAEPYGQYIIRRGFRLFPLYLVALAFSTLLLPVQLEAWRILAPTPENLNRGHLAQEAIGDLWHHLLAHLPLLQGIVPRTINAEAAYTIIGQAWSISLEWQFYLLTPLLMAAVRFHRLRIVAACAVAVLVLASRWFSDAFLGAKILHFLVGMASYFALKGRDRFGWIAACSVLGLAMIVKGGVWQAVPLGIWAAALWSSVQPAHSHGHRLASLLGSRATFHVGEISYSIYLLHMIPLYGSIFLLERAGIGGPWLQIAATATTLIVTYLAANLAYVAIEKPGIRLGSQLTSGRFVGAAPATS